MYTNEDLKKISGDQLSIKYYPRALTALNGLIDLFGKSWVEAECVVQFLNDKEIIRALGGDRVYGGIGDLEKLVFLWEDIQQIKDLNGFDDIKKKLRVGLRNQNVDFEVSITSDLVRCNCIVELEPKNGNGESKADCRFRVSAGDPWVYVEMTRKISATIQEKLKNRGEELAGLVSLIYPPSKGVLVLKKNIDEIQYKRVVEWLRSKPPEGEFEGTALFFTVPYNGDETRLALQYVQTPISIRSSGNVLNGTFGSAYLHIPDYGAKSKLLEKVKQLPKNELNLLVIDVTVIGVSDWKEQIIFDDSALHCSAVLLTSDGISSDGYNREVTAIINVDSENKLPEKINTFLVEFSKIRQKMNLMY
jgi:hypothetical protein